MFGEVLDGKSIIRKIEGLPTQSDKPTKDVTIVGTNNEKTPKAEGSCLVNKYYQTAASFQLMKP